MVGFGDGVHHQGGCRDSVDNQYGVGLLGFLRYQMLDDVGL